MDTFEISGPENPSRLYSGVIGLAIFSNLMISGVILGGYALSLEVADVSGRFFLCALLAGIASAYLAVRITYYPVRARVGDSTVLYSVCMLLSIAIPMALFLLFDSSKAFAELGPLLFSQSLFMVIVFGIKNYTAHQSF